MSKKYRKKPVVVEAVQFTGSNWGEIETFVPVGKYNDDGTFNIVTLEGELRADVGDYIIKGVRGEFYPCKPDVFERTYELVEDEEDVHAIGELDSYTRMLYERNERLVREIQEAIAALKFYAERPCIEKIDIGWDVGFVARDALKKIKGQ